MKYMIGQRVIYQNVICTVCKPEHPIEAGSNWIWIYNPGREYKHAADFNNLKPLPGGQL